MSYTVGDLTESVLRSLAIIDATESPSAEDETYVADVWSAKWEELSGHGVELTYFPYNDIPNPVFLTIRDLVANEVRGAYGKPIAAAEKEAEEMIILKRLRRHVQQQATGLPGKAVYF